MVIELFGSLVRHRDQRGDARRSASIVRTVRGSKA
jgi:hypothetical protein